MTNVNGFTVNSAMWWENNRLGLAQQFGAILLTIAGIWLSIWLPSALEEFKSAKGVNWYDNLFFWMKGIPIWAFFFSSLVSIYGGVLGHRESARRETKIQELETTIEAQYELSDRLEEAQLSVDYLQIQIKNDRLKVTSEYLGHISKDHLSLTDKERISLYVIHSDDFYLVGRHSLNDTYTKFGRHKLSKDEGCIGYIWNNGGEEGRGYCRLPDNEKSRQDELKSKYSMNVGVAKSLRMPSIHYWCVLLIAEGYERAGIVVVESTRDLDKDNEDIYLSINEHSPFLLQRLRVSRDDIEKEIERISGEPHV